MQACAHKHTHVHKPLTVKLLEAAEARCTLMQVPVGLIDRNQYAFVLVLMYLA